MGSTGKICATQTLATGRQRKQGNFGLRNVSCRDLPLTSFDLEMSRERERRRERERSHKTVLSKSVRPGRKSLFHHRAGWKKSTSSERGTMCEGAPRRLRCDATPRPAPPCCAWPVWSYSARPKHSYHHRAGRGRRQDEAHTWYRSDRSYWGALAFAGLLYALWQRQLTAAVQASSFLQSLRRERSRYLKRASPLRQVRSNFWKKNAVSLEVVSPGAKKTFGTVGNFCLVKSVRDKNSSE